MKAGARARSKARVLFILPSLHGGGAERVMLHLLTHLDRERFHPFLALGAVTGAFVGDVPADVEVFDLKAPRSRHAVGAVLRTVRAVRPGTVMATCMNFAAAAARPLFPRGTRLVLREGNSISAFLEEVARTSPLRAAAYRVAYRTLYATPDVVLAQSDFMLNDMADHVGIPRSKLRRIYNPVDVEGVRAAATRGERPLTGAGPHLVGVGGLYWRKGWDVLIRAVATVRQAYPDVTLAIVGEGEERAALERLRDGLGLSESVRMPGFDGNPYRWMAAADLFVSPSRYEGFANVIAEALACGTPIVATDCPSANREVVDEGVNGFLAPVDDAAGLAATILRALGARGGLDRQAIARGCDRRFAIQHIVPLYEDLLT